MSSDSLITAAINNDIEPLMKLVHPDRTKNDSDTKYDLKIEDSNSIPLKTNGLSLLHIAAFANSLECFLYLQSKCNFPLDIQSNDAKTPFHYAVYAGSCDVAEYILQYYETNYGLKELERKLFMDDYINPENKKTSILFLAALSKTPQIFSLIFKYGYSCDKFSVKCKETIQDSFKFILSSKNIGCLTALLANMAKTKLSADSTPIMHTIMVQQSEAVPLLLGANFDPSFVSAENRTAMSLACFYSLEDTVKQLADVMDNVDLPPNIKAQAAVHWICQSKKPSIAKILCAKGIDVNRLDRDGRMGPYYSLDIGEEKDTIEILKEFLNSGLNINYHSKDKNTILGDFLTAITTPTQIIDFLLDNGADPNAIIYSQSLTKQTCLDQTKKKARSNPKLRAVYEKHFGPYKPN